MLFRPILSSALILLALTGSVMAGETRQSPRAVLELFTSQGCSASPEADAMLEELSKRRDIISLAYHVDYWDYVGWPDSFGAEANSERQRAYAKSWGSSRIFTPQMVVNGIKGVVASREADVQSAMMKELAQLAAELQAGKATKEEASRRFVGLVIKQKFGKQKGKGADKMEEAVNEMVEADPQFVSRLQGQLKRIAGG